VEPDWTQSELNGGPARVVRPRASNRPSGHGRLAPVPCGGFPCAAGDPPGSWADRYDEGPFLPRSLPERPYPGRTFVEFSLHASLEHCPIPLPRPPPADLFLPDLHSCGDPPTAGTHLGSRQLAWLQRELAPRARDLEAPDVEHLHDGHRPGAGSPDHLNQW